MPVWPLSRKPAADVRADDVKSGAPVASPAPAADTLAIAPAAPQSPVIPVWASRPSPLRTMTEPVRQLIPGHNERHAMRQTLHQKIYAATEMSQRKDVGSAEAWREIVQLCTMLKISLVSQLRRCGGTPPILEKLLDARDFEALGVLCEILPHGLEHGRVRVSKVVKNGGYIGELQTYYENGYAKVRAHGYGYSRFGALIRYGHFYEDLLSGHHCVWDNGLKRLEGSFSKGWANGEITQIDATGVAHGSWVNGKPNGVVRFTGNNGIQKILTYENGKILRTHTISPEGTHYEGEVAGTPPLPHGQGKQTRADGAVYEGSFQMSKPHGSGAYTFGFESPLFGYRYNGPLVDGKLHGHGTFTNIATGATQACFHLNNTLKSPPPPSLQYPSQEAPEPV